MKVEKIILGTAQLGLQGYGINNSLGKPSHYQVMKILDVAVHAGIKYLDTAEAYGNAESLIGDYLSKKPSSKFEVITKMSTSNGEEIIDKIEKTLRRLRVDCIDTYLFHSHTDYQGNPKAFEDLLEQREQGKIRRLGVSVYTNKEVESLLVEPEIDVIQLPFNLLDNNSQRGDVINKAKAAGKAVLSRSVFLQGLFFMPPNSLPPHLSVLFDQLKELETFTSKEGIAMNELALNYALSKHCIDGVLLGVETADQLIQNLESLQTTLPQSVVSDIDNIKVQNPDLLNPALWKT